MFLSFSFQILIQDGDLTSAEFRKKLLLNTIEKFKRLDVLVCFLIWKKILKTLPFNNKWIQHVQGMFLIVNTLKIF